MVRNWMFILLSYCFTASVIANTNSHSYFYQRGNKVLVVQINDSKATLEYCYLDFKNQYQYKCDTLNCVNQNYIGKFSRIIRKNQSFIFKPGKLVLKEGFPDSSCNYFRNDAYLHFIEAAFNRKFEWQGGYMPVFQVEKFRSSLNLPLDAFRKIVQQHYDSLCRLCTSTVVSDNFIRVKVNNYKWLNRRHIESSDSLTIAAWWSMLASGKPVKNNNILYLAQYPLTLVPLMEINFDAALLSSAFIYPILIVTEKFVDDRIHASSTYKVHFIPRDMGKQHCKIKIRKSVILGKNINYKLPFNVEEMLTNYN